MSFDRVVSTVAPPIRCLRYVPKIHLLMVERFLSWDSSEQDKHFHS